MGRRCAELLAEAGACVTLLDLHVPEALRGIENISAIEGDVSDGESIRAAIEIALQNGRLDAAINAAGMTGTLGPILAQHDDAMDQLLSVNVRGMFLAMKYEALAMMRAGGGAIVNFASVYSNALHANMVLYGASKHAVAGLTKGAAVEFAEHGIRVNAVAPGPILTPFIGEITPEIENSVVAGIPQSRIGEPDEVASAALWLISDAASYITGSIINIDGGQSAKLSG